MRRLTVNSLMTLDGVIEAPGQPEPPDTGFAQGGWMVNHWNEEIGRAMDQVMSRGFDLVLGRRTYDLMAAHWPSATSEAGAEEMNNATKYVASRGRPCLTWSNSVLIEPDIAAGITDLKEEDGPDLQEHGSSNLVRTLRRHRLIDEYRLWTFPVLVGSGKRLFDLGTGPEGLRLVDLQTFQTGVLFATYEPKGER